jgi:hypothetical protein
MHTVLYRHRAVNVLYQCICISRYQIVVCSFIKNPRSAFARLFFYFSLVKESGPLTEV